MHETVNDEDNLPIQINPDVGPRYIEYTANKTKRNPQKT